MIDQDLFRVVNPVELDDIETANQYRLIEGVEVKYFSTDIQIGRSMKKGFDGFYGDGPYTVTTSTFHFPALPEIVNISGEGEVWVLRQQNLPHGPVDILPE